MDRIRAGQCERDQRMPHLVVSHGFPLCLAEHAALFLQPCDEALDGLREVIQIGGLCTAPGCDERSFVDEVFEVCACKARRQACDGFDVESRRGLNLLQVHTEDFYAAFSIGPVDQNLPVEATCPKERGIEHLRAIGRRQYDYSNPWIEAVHLG